MSYYFLRKEFKFQDYRAITSQKERLLFLLNPTTRDELNFKVSFSPIYKWLTHKGECSNTFYINFNDIVNPRKQFNIVSSLAKFLDKDSSWKVDYREVAHLMIEKIDSKTCPAFRKGIINDWKNEFDDEIKKVFKNQVGDLLIKYGFEKDNSW